MDRFSLCILWDSLLSLLSITPFFPRLRSSSLQMQHNSFHVTPYFASKNSKCVFFLFLGKNILDI